MICVVYDLTGCTNPDPDPGKLLAAMRESAELLGTTVRDELTVEFEPQGFTGVLILAESHLIVTTWPEHQLAHVDLFTCRADTDPDNALQPVFNLLGAAEILPTKVNRTFAS
jgi:S-adenosylmethionine decarboxylase proenzyme